MGSQNQAAATFGAGTFLALGLVGLMCTSFVNQVTSLSLDPFLRLWAETILAVVFGFVLLIAGFLIGSTTGMGSIAGGVLGAIASILGVINALLLLTLTEGIISQGIISQGGILGGVSDSQIAISFELLFVMTIVVLVVGMPLVLVGSFRHMRESSGEGV